MRARWGSIIGLAAILAVACVGGSGTTPPISGSEAESSSPAPGRATPGNPALITEPSPSAVATVMTATELREAVDTERAGGLAPRYVLADVSIDTSRKPDPIDRECDPYGQCEVIGTLSGFDEDAVVAVRHEDRVLPPATDSASLAAPVALLLTNHGPIEFLGHALAAPGGGMTWPVADALAAIQTAPDEQVVAVKGWMEEAEEPSCGPAWEVTPPKPFDCIAIHSYITPTAETLGHSSSPNSWEIDKPADGISLQMGAYSDFALNPEWNDINAVPREGVYLVRMVVYDGPGCEGCRSWLAVGRLDPGPTASSVPPGPIVRSPAELEQLLSADRSSWVGKLVLVDGSVGPGKSVACPGKAPCSIGTLQSTPENVVATPFTMSMLPADTDFVTHGIMTLRVLDSGLEFLGDPGFNVDGSFFYSVAQLSDPLVINHVPLLTVEVMGWLVSGPVFSCPTVVEAGDGTPFQNCPPPDWISAEELTANDGMEWTKAGDVVDVQPGAYPDYAANPEAAGTEPLMAPRQGIYTLRLISVTIDGSPKVGWQLVGRVDPSMNP